MKLAFVEKKNFLSWTAMHIDFVMCNNKKLFKEEQYNAIFSILIETDSKCYLTITLIEYCIKSVFWQLIWLRRTTKIGFMNEIFS